jgi:multisubunit Na+/H+ antiporter MnhG subunit
MKLLIVLTAVRGAVVVLRFKDGFYVAHRSSKVTSVGNTAPLAAVNKIKAARAFVFCHLWRSCRVLVGLEHLFIATLSLHWNA